MDDPAAAVVDEPGTEPAKPARRYRGLDPDQRRADRRRRLLDAATEQFGTVGYQATTITGLCRAAGVTTQHFYDEFESREQLLWALFDEIVDDVARCTAEALVGVADDMRSHARAGLGAFLHAMLDDPRRARIQCLETVGISPESEVRRRRVLRQYADLVFASAERVDGANGRRPRGTRFVSLALVAGVNDSVIEWLHMEDPPPIDELVDELAELFEVVGDHYAIEA